LDSTLPKKKKGRKKKFLTNLPIRHEKGKLKRVPKGGEKGEKKG